MALFKHANNLGRNTSIEFDKVRLPGSPTPYSGIYRCAGCGYEVASNETQPLPPQNHRHYHVPGVPVRWRLVVAAQHLR